MRVLLLRRVPVRFRATTRSLRYCSYNPKTTPRREHPEKAEQQQPRRGIISSVFHHRYLTFDHWETVLPANIVKSKLWLKFREHGQVLVVWYIVVALICYWALFALLYLGVVPNPKAKNIDGEAGEEGEPKKGQGKGRAAACLVGASLLNNLASPVQVMFCLATLPQVRKMLKWMKRIK
eukprot:TRINITY_DN86275_c0_g1_i1.p1 TRINITY_DN86275_c0_g1~~TRINITY_DN86275_c0_g1_i1.p1  ORF type:complete len:179 (-),score=13.73 TRINITY_DN86275_c0_g1_i1:208-744(-)